MRGWQILGGKKQKPATKVAWGAIRRIFLWVFSSLDCAFPVCMLGEVCWNKLPSMVYRSKSWGYGWVSARACGSVDIFQSETWLIGKQYYSHERPFTGLSKVGVTFSARDVVATECMGAFHRSRRWIKGKRTDMKTFGKVEKCLRRAIHSMLVRYLLHTRAFIIQSLSVDRRALYLVPPPITRTSRATRTWDTCFKQYCQSTSDKTNASTFLIVRLVQRAALWWL